jgi:type II secretory pathway component GspD/PulD (secretin)
LISDEVISAITASINTCARSTSSLLITSLTLKVIAIGINFNQQIPSLLTNKPAGSSSLINSLKPGVSFLFGKQNKDANGKISSALGMVINALNSLGNANILSTPSIVTCNPLQNRQHTFGISML